MDAPDPTRSPADRVGSSHLALALATLAAAVALRVPALFGAGSQRALDASDAWLVFGLCVPGVLPVLAARVLPPRIGARGFAFPRLRAAALGLHALAAAALLVATVRPPGGPVRAHWLLTMAYDAGATGPAAAWMLVAAGLAGASAALSALGVLATVHGLRARGVSWRRLPGGAWGLYAMAWVHVVAAPALVGVAGVALLERAFGLGVFAVAAGGDALLFGHFFWFAVHPALVSVALPALGLALEALDRPGAEVRPGPRRALFALAFLSFPAWGQHLVASGISELAAMVFSAWSLLALLPALYLIAVALTSARPAGGRPARAVVISVLSLGVLALLVQRAMAAATLAVAVGHDVMLFGRPGLDLLTALTALVLAQGFAPAAGARRAAPSPLPALGPAEG